MQQELRGQGKRSDPLSRGMPLGVPHLRFYGPRGPAGTSGTSRLGWQPWARSVSLWSRTGNRYPAVAMRGCWINGSLHERHDCTAGRTAAIARASAWALPAPGASFTLRAEPESNHAGAVGAKVVQRRKRTRTMARELRPLFAVVGLALSSTAAMFQPPTECGQQVATTPGSRSSRLPRGTRMLMVRTLSALDGNRRAMETRA